MRPRNWLYHSYILDDLKKETLAEGAGSRREEREVVRAARTVREYDDRFISPRYGFRGADDYYELCAPLSYMPEIRVPTMVLAACDDPWIPAEYYRDFKWSDNPCAAVGDGRRRRASRLPLRRQRPAVVRHGAGEIPRTEL